MTELKRCECPCCGGAGEHADGICPTCRGAGQVVTCECGETFYDCEARWWFYIGGDAGMFRVGNGWHGHGHCPGECGCRLSVVDGEPRHRGRRLAGRRQLARAATGDRDQPRHGPGADTQRGKGSGERMTILLAFRGGTMLKIVICGCDVLDWLNPHFLIEIGLPWVGHIGAMAGRKPRGGYVYRVRAQWRRGHLHERWWET